MVKKIKQVVVIHGGDSFHTYKEYVRSLKHWKVSIGSFRAKTDWKGNLSKDLGKKYDVLMPRMPNRTNARYVEWKIWFERMFPYLKNGVVLVGHSLGGAFLAKYLSENSFPKKISGLLLVAPPYDYGDFAPKGSLQKIAKQCKSIHVYQSLDDPVVSPKEAEKYKAKLPEIEPHVFKNRGHFSQEHFPELVQLIEKVLA
ncbi:MAG: alpha/beta hydrolase [Candidatus Wildermuthbacteria bacterium]|nr:alpha/beta hydrolase [Candidatus Wildermuthbacteria bacterium]